MRDDCLSRAHVESAGRVFHAEHAAQHNRELIESGLCPGSSQPAGLLIWATLAAELAVFTRPTYSSMIFGLVPAAAIREG